MSTRETGVQEWQDIHWAKVEQAVFTLQRRIYQASRTDDRKVVHRLQRLLMSSRSAKLLAVRRVTQDNQGKRTAGVDGIASLTPEERLTLVESLDLEAKPKPVRRVWIPKPGTDEKRGLGIPTMYDRALQALVKLALEPEWEAKFEPNSYGFRPGRSAQDAIDTIFNSIRYQPKFVLDADIAKCFDRINHEALLDKINTFPKLRRIIRAWLKAGMLDGNTIFPTEEGTPQGGVISPLLANIALHGLEDVILNSFPKTKWIGGKNVPWTPTVVRYADDFVILHRERAVVEECKAIAQEWLKGIGLELKPSKTRLTHTLQEEGGQTGFDFLGFNVRQYPQGKYRSGKNTVGKPLGFKTLIKPSREKELLHQRELAGVVRQMRNRPQALLIHQLNLKIRGWSNYYRAVVSRDIFERCDHVLYQSLFSWAKRRHRNKGVKWVLRKYWLTPSVFGVQDGPVLRKHSDTKIVRHVKVAGDRSPYDGDWVYWSSRMGRYPNTRLIVAMLLKKQKGRCKQCGLYFKSDDLIEVHHLDGDHGNSKKGNLAVLHRHCHDTVHRGKEDDRAEGIHDKDWQFEEPCEGERLMHGSEDQYDG